MIVHPFTCRCPDCLKQRNLPYRHVALPGDLERHVKLRQQMEGLQRESRWHQEAIEQEMGNAENT